MIGARQPIAARLLGRILALPMPRWLWLRVFYRWDNIMRDWVERVDGPIGLDDEDDEAA